MNGTSFCFLIVGIIYVGTSIGLLVHSHKIYEKTKSNPLSKTITDEEIDQIIIKNNGQNDYNPYYKVQKIKEKKNLRFLMDYEKCNEYIKKIKELKTKDERYRDLNDVFEVDVGFINTIISIFFYSLIIVLIYVVYIYVVYTLSVCCCEQFMCLVDTCYPCFACFMYIFGLSYLVLLIVLIYQKYWSSAKDFADFTDCSNVNKYYLVQHYSDIIDLGDHASRCLYFLLANMVACCCMGYSSKQEEGNIKEYHVTVLTKPIN